MHMKCNENTVFLSVMKCHGLRIEPTRSDVACASVWATTGVALPCVDELRYLDLFIIRRCNVGVAR